MKKICLSIAIIASLFAGCNNSSKQISESSNELIIFHAGSLSIPFKQSAEAFKKLNPGVNIYLESAGSVKCARKITDLKMPCDIMASADYTVIDEMLIPKYTSWNIAFASNEMCLVYHDASKYSKEINKENWYEIILKEDVAYGRSDPNSDPCGYRTILTSQLAEKFYNEVDLSAKLIEKDTRYMRPKEVDLLALLETNSIDYIFLYRSVAEQHGLKYLILPDEINLKNSAFTAFYKSASVEIVGQKPGEKLVKYGEPMVYGITILDNAPNKKLAIEFVKFMLTEDRGMEIMKRNGQPSLIPSLSKTYSNIPDELKQFAKAQ